MEYLRIMKEIWTKPRVAFDGRFVHVPEAGASGPIQSSGRTSRSGLVGTATPRSDGSWRWATASIRSAGRPPVHLYPDEMRVKVARLREMAAAAGRDPAGITISFKAPLRFDDTDSGSPVPLAGPPAKIIEDLGAYVAAGVEHFVLDFSVTAVPEMLDVLERFAADIRPRVRA